MIKVYNRTLKQYEEENVAGDAALNWTYSSPVGMTVLEAFVKKKMFSSIYGKYCNSKLSRKKIKPFIKKFNIDIEEAEKNADDFTSFNDFFYRKLKPSARPINMDSNILVSPGDGRLTVLENIDIEHLVQIKGITYRLAELVPDNQLALNYQGGLCLILRLCPLDYHRFHFVDNGVSDKVHKISGDYYSVNPIALAKVPELFCRNKREWCTFHSDNFGDIIYVEVGATCVGSIIQTSSPGCRVSKGDEKGFFKFGGSTIILFIEKNKVKITEEIINQSFLGFETKVNVGEQIGIKNCYAK